MFFVLEVVYGVMLSCSISCISCLHWTRFSLSCFQSLWNIVSFHAISPLNIVVNMMMIVVIVAPSIPLAMMMGRVVECCFLVVSVMFISCFLFVFMFFSYNIFVD